MGGRAGFYPNESLHGDSHSGEGGRDRGRVCDGRRHKRREKLFLLNKLCLLLVLFDSLLTVRLTVNSHLVIVTDN